MVQASIITIGDELLIGQVIDTNSAWMAQELNKAGIPVVRRVAVGDVWEQIWRALDEESRHSDIVLITGGLGPTADDITKPLLCQYFKGRLVVDEAALKNVEYLFKEVFRRPLTGRNLKQAQVPDTCTVIQNKKGTAPGMWFEKEGKVFVSMPGVPFEMKGMMEADVIPRLQARFTVQYITHRTLLTAGIGESALADPIQDFETALPAVIKLAYLPSFGMVRLRLSISGVPEQEANALIDSHFTQLQQLVQPHLVTNVDEPLHQTVARLLIQTGKTVATAESCTGGYMAHLLTQKAGASQYFNGSVVSYSNTVKEALLGVSNKSLQEHGAVSEVVVRQMVQGALNIPGTDYAIAVSGIMGPGGGTPDKPTGTVWIAVASKQTTDCRKMHFRFDRERNMQHTANVAFNMLRQLIIAEM
ncbi:MAG TPA: competence/damage-inducible protein A [Ferruginibacter sp.]|nr:competence/damage-inducible protein A [Ferruginibacter sp.]